MGSQREQFEDRESAAASLAAEISKREQLLEIDLVLAIPRGGLPLGRVIADALDAELDVIVAKKIGAPNNPEYAIGAVSSNGSVWRNEEAFRLYPDIDEAYFEDERSQKAAAARETERVYRRDRNAPELDGKSVLVVDDGVATGSTLLACLASLEQSGVETVWVAIPVGPPDTIAELEQVADGVICLRTPSTFQGVGQFYRDFSQVSDSEAIEYLKP